jgi:preprotein translocase subunit SecF
MVVDPFGQRKWDLVGLRKLWFAISLLIILPGVYVWRVRGLNYGIDFTGGGLVTYQLAQPVASAGEAATLARARQAVNEAGVAAQLQIAGTATRKDQLLVRTRVVSEAGRGQDAVLKEQQERMLATLSEAFPGVSWQASDMVTPVVSKELIRNAIWSVLAGCVFVLFWIRLRYMSFQWSGSALLALVHDVLVLIGVFAVTGREVNSPFVAAALTVVGYSVHDTIVIFDRIRENLRLRKGNTFAETANISLLETMPRSINTVLTTEFVLVALYMFGGVSLRNFTFAMIVGITVGAYSSIFNASQFLAVLKNREERGVARRRALAGRPVREAPASSRQATARRPAPVKPAQGQGQAAERAPARAEQAEARASDAAAQQQRLPKSARKKLKAGKKRKKRF